MIGIKPEIYNLIAKDKFDQLTNDEKFIFEEWLNMSPSNRQAYEDIRAILDLNESDNIVVPDKENTWNAIMNSIKPLREETGKIYRLPFLIKLSSAVAIIAVVFTLSLNYIINSRNFRINAERITSVIAPPGQKSQVILPDGTNVWLNSGSKISYSSSFIGKTRNINLEGEAFFDVKKDKKHPFIVTVSGVDIKVLGTAFNINSFMGDEVKVTLIRGKIALEQTSNHKLISELLPGKRIDVDKQNFRYSIEDCNAEESILWAQDQLVIENKSFNEMINMLNNWYGVQIKTINNYNNNDKYTFKIKTESLTEAFKLVNLLTPIEYKIDGKEVIVKKTSIK